MPLRLMEIFVTTARLAGLAFGLLCLTPGGAATFVLPADGTDVVGEVRTIVAGDQDTLLDIARRNGLGYQDIVLANPGVDPWVPGEGTEVVLPTQFIIPHGVREGILINLPELRLYYFPPPADDGAVVVETYAISIGRMDWRTPLGTTSIKSKVKKPTWYPPESIRAEHAAEGRPLPRVVPAGPRNPLGLHALQLALSGYLIHGTNRPAGVGMRVTHGCIRMFPEAISHLYQSVPINTRVTITNQPYKVGWSGEQLFLEAHPPLEEKGDQMEQGLTALTSAYVTATDERTVEVDWDVAERIFSAAQGIPSPMSATPRARPAGLQQARGMANCPSRSCGL